MKTVRVILVDDDPTMRETLSWWLSRVPGVHVVAQAASGSEAVAHLERTPADLVLTDVEMPGMSGFELAFQVIQMADAPRVVTMSSSDRPEYPLLSRKAGADAFLPKTGICEQLSRYLRTQFALSPMN